MKKLLILITSAFLVLAITVSACAHYCSEYIKDGSDTRVEEAISRIAKQNHSEISSEQLVEYIRHFAYTSKYAAFGGEDWPFPNYLGIRDIIVDDGKYQVNAGRATGCFAYAEYVSNIIYGYTTSRVYPEGQRSMYTAEQIRGLIESHAQAGEHIRIDSKHSEIFVSCDADGYYYLDYYTDSDPVIEFCYASYSDVADYIDRYNFDYFIYDSDSAVNDVTEVREKGVALEVYYDDYGMHRIYAGRKDAEEFVAEYGGTMFEKTGGYEVILPAQKITVSFSNAKSYYLPGESFDFSGITVSAVYSDIHSYELPAGKIAVSGFDSSRPGTNVITVQYGGYSSRFELTVASKGDLNLDGKVRPEDARTVLRYCADLTELSDDQRTVGDVDGDGRIRAADARLILRTAAGLS